MSDVKDILGLGKGGAHPEVAPKKEKSKVRERPSGLSREAFNLLYGQHPIAPTRLLDEVVKKEEVKSAPTTQVSFQFIPFKNEARTDDLRLYHWVQCYKDANGQTRPADDGPYSFAKYNTKVGAYKYDDIEYETVIRPNLPDTETGWSKEETDYLLDLCESLDLRFIVIADRWDFPGGPKRSVEDLKEHYYAIAYELAIARAGDKVLANTNPIVRHPFDANKERERKQFLRLSLNRGQHKAEDEDAVIAQAEAILQRRKKQAAAKRPQGAPLSHPSSYSNSISEVPFFDQNVVPFAPHKPGVYSRRAMLEDAAKKATQQLQPVQKVQKVLENVMSEVAAPIAPIMATRAISGMYLALHSEALQLVELKLRTARPSTRPEEGRGKRSIKVKALRHDDEVTPIAPKRARSTR